MERFLFITSTSLIRNQPHADTIHCVAPSQHNGMQTCKSSVEIIKSLHPRVLGGPVRLRISFYALAPKPQWHCDHTRGSGSSRRTHDRTLKLVRPFFVVVITKSFTTHRTGQRNLRMTVLEMRSKTTRQPPPPLHRLLAARTFWPVAADAVSLRVLSMPAELKYSTVCGPDERTDQHPSAIHVYSSNLTLRCLGPSRPPRKCCVSNRRRLMKTKRTRMTRRRSKSP